jgi:hypothetical protein
MKTNSPLLTIMLLGLTALYCSGCASSSSGVLDIPPSGPFRVVVAPRQDQGSNFADQSSIERKTVAALNAQLVRHGIDSVNVYAINNGSAGDTNSDLCKAYATDGAILVAINGSTSQTMDAKCTATVQLSCDGYDSAGSDLGVSLSRQYVVTANSCDSAINEAVTIAGGIAGNLIAQKLKTHSSSDPDYPGSQEYFYTPPPGFD